MGDFVTELRAIVSASPVGEKVEESVLEQCKCHSSFEQFKDYCCNKAFEVIGDDAQYKKYFSQSKENAEKWAIKVHNSIIQVTQDIKSVHHLVDSLQVQGKDKIYRLCIEVMASSNPPVRKRNGWYMCSISGTRSDSCIEVGRRGKDNACIIIHQKFTPFVLYMWFCCKLEHIVKNQARLWTTKQDTDEVDKLCSKFQQSDEMIRRWYEIFYKSVMHVKLSILMEGKLVSL